MESSQGGNLITKWFVWHFYEMPQFLFLVWGNYLSFGSYYFSIPILFLTFFSPWRRYRWRYPKGFDVGGYLNVFISNSFSRFIGMILRFFLIILGIIAEVVIFIVGLGVIISWVLIPFFITTALVLLIIVV